MPTPSAIRDIVRHRTHIAIDLSEAIRLARQVAGCEPAATVVVHGRDPRTGRPVDAVLSIHDLLTPPSPG